MGVPGFGQAFDDEGRGVLVELIDMGPDPAMFGLLEDEGKGIAEFLMRAKPDEFAFSGVDVRLENLGILTPHQRIDAVAGDDKVVIAAILLGRFELGLKPQVDAKVAGAGLQQHQHRLSPDPGKAMPARHHALAVVHDGDVVPIGEFLADRGGADRVVVLHAAQRIIRQHHPPAKGVIGAVAFQHRHLMRRVAQFHRNGEVKTSGTAAKA